MRQIDTMTTDQIDVLRLKGMLSYQTGIKEWQNDQDEWNDNRDNDYELELRGENEPTDCESDQHIEALDELSKWEDDETN